METSFFDIAQHIANSFETAERVNGEKFIRGADNAPEWVKGWEGLIGQAHRALDGRGPDDWVYASIHSLACALSDYPAESAEHARDIAGELAEDLVDVYNLDRAAWLASNIHNAHLVDEAADEFGQADGVFDGIGRGQYLAARRVLETIIDVIETQLSGR